MKFLEKLEEIVIEVQLAKQALEDKTEEGITHKLKFAKKRRKSLFYFHNINPPELHTPVYLSPIDRLVPIEFNSKLTALRISINLLLEFRQFVF